MKKSSSKKKTKQGLVKHGSLTHKSTIALHHTAKTVKKSVIKKVSAPLKTKLFGKKFCPSCGKILSTTQCEDCAEVDFDFKDILITLCTECHSYLRHNKWNTFKSLNVVIKTVAQDAIKEKLTQKIAKVTIKHIAEDVAEEILASKAGVRKPFTIPVAKHGELFDIPATYFITKCPKCAKKNTQYFEGILQVRNATPEILDDIRTIMQAQAKKGIYVNKEATIEKYDKNTKLTGENIDFYLTDKTYVHVLGEYLKKTYGGVLKKNAKLFSVDWTTSKQIYRPTLFITFPSFTVGMVIKKDEHLYLIKKVGTRITVIDLKTSHKTSLPHKDYDILKPVSMQVIKTYPEYELLDPNSYYQCRLMNPNDSIKVNQKILVIIDGAEAWMI